MLAQWLRGSSPRGEGTCGPDHALSTLDPRTGLRLPGELVLGDLKFQGLP